ncbi:MAG: HAD family hydrolase [Candidatus Omnitrophota bacterium]
MRAIIFDMDGLMIDSERLYQETQQEMARQFGKTMPEGMRQRMMGRKPIESLRLFVEELAIPADPETLLDYRTGIMREKLTHELVPMPGLFHIIDTFYRRLKLAIGTGAQAEFLDLVIDGLGIREKFDVLQSSDDIKHGKPDPEIYLNTCRQLGVDPSECFVLEDALNGVLAGKHAGCHVIAVPTVYTRDQDFGIADFSAQDLFEASRYIEGMLSRSKK